MDLNTVWFLLFAILIAGYAMLDGFDLGVGVLHLFARSDEERDVHVAAIGPVWDGNEVWLVTAGGALFAAFPPVYATVFSGFYIALMLLLLALIARAVSMEFRHAHDSARWVKAWDYAFGIGSLVPALLFGVAVGNVMRGVPIGADGAWGGTFLGLLNPYSLMIGVVSLAMMTMHGATYLHMKSEGALEARLAAWIPKLWGVFLALYAAATVWSVVALPHLFERVSGNPLFWLLTLALVTGIVGIPLANARRRAGWAFLSSCATVVSMVGVTAVSMYPTLVFSSSGPALGLTIYNASASPLALRTMLVIALLGMPLVIGYTVFTYRLFKGKAQPHGGY